MKIDDIIKFLETNHVLDTGRGIDVYPPHPEEAAAAKLLRECHAAGFITDSGEVRKVLGTLPLTADGAIVTPDGFVWHDRPHGVIGWRVLVMYSNGPHHREFDPEWSGCYSTREAAEAARGEK